MRPRYALWFFAVALCEVALLSVPRHSMASSALYESGSDPALGFNLVSWWNFGSSGASTWQNAVQSAYDAGFREISISPLRFVNINTGAISATSPRGPDLSHVEAGVERAKSLGMRVTLNPFVELFDAHNAGTGDDEYFADLPGGCTWRGCWNPTAGSAVSNQFWTDYQSYLTGVAQIASNYNVDAMTIGTEMKALDGNSAHNASWGSAITAVDNVYSGPLGYSANWDDYHNANLQAAIWENPKIDFIGIDSYFNSVLYDYYKYTNPALTTTQINTLVTNAVNPIQGYPDAAFIDLMTSAWNKYLDIDTPQVSSGGRTYFEHDGILPYAAARKGGAGMPVQFTEQGYLYFNTSSASPQTSSGSIDTSEQIMAYQALLLAMDGRQNSVRAIDVWQWEMPGSNGSQWNINTSASADQPNNRRLAILLSRFVRNLIPGDFNLDGRVDANDYVVWRNTQGQIVTLFDGADGNGDGTINAADYTIWRSYFGATVAAGTGAASPLPEPAAAWFLVSTALISIMRPTVRRSPPQTIE